MLATDSTTARSPGACAVETWKPYQPTEVIATATAAHSAPLKTLRMLKIVLMIFSSSSLSTFWGCPVHPLNGVVYDYITTQPSSPISKSLHD